MTTQTISPSERTMDMVQAEANALEQLIERRNEWLNKPDNKHSPAFEATKKDTLTMVWRHSELLNEISQFEKENKY
jgi:hypothetical protein